MPGYLKDALSGEPEFGHQVSLDASSRVMPDVKASNIVGKIPGTETDSMILLSAHYDSYFDGFQDDNAAIAMMLGIARALVKGGYQACSYHRLLCHGSGRMGSDRLQVRLVHRGLQSDISRTSGMAGKSNCQI